MTLPVSGNPLSLSQIQTEFGGTNPASLSEYYAGGVNVPAGTVGYPGGVSTPIPSSSTISIANFYGSTQTSYTFYITVGTSGAYKGYASGSYGSISGSYVTSLGTITGCNTLMIAGPGPTYYTTTLSGISGVFANLIIGPDTYTYASRISDYVWLDAGGSIFTTSPNGTVITCTLNVV
jgi:hypothetical protein